MAALAILDVRNSLWITFLAILDKYRFFFKFLQNGCRWPFWLSENHFRSHFYPFHIDTQLFDKMADVGHFGCPNFTFDRISGHFRSIRNFIFFEIFDKISDVGHFGCPKFTFDRISGHFRSIQNFFPAAILNVWKSLWIAFLAISDWSAILDVRNSLSMAFLAISDPYGTLFLF